MVAIMCNVLGGDTESGTIPFNDWTALFYPQSLVPIMDLYLNVLIRTLLARLSSKHCPLSHPPPSQQEKVKRFAVLWHFHLPRFFSPGPVRFSFGPQPRFSHHLCSHGIRLSMTSKPPFPLRSWMTFLSPALSFLFNA